MERPGNFRTLQVLMVQQYLHRSDGLVTIDHTGCVYTLVMDVWV